MIANGLEVGHRRVTKRKLKAPQTIDVVLLKRGIRLGQKEANPKVIADGLEVGHGRETKTEAKTTRTIDVVLLNKGIRLRQGASPEKDRAAEKKNIVRRKSQQWTTVRTIPVRIRK